jgi:hypothetical protein
MGRLQEEPNNNIIMAVTLLCDSTISPEAAEKRL